MADERIVQASKLVDPTTTSQELGVDSDGQITVKVGDGTETANVNSNNRLEVDIAEATASVAVTHAALTELAAAIDTELQTDVVTMPADTFVADAGALGKGVLIQGDDGTDRNNVTVDTDGHLQVDVLSGGAGVTHTDDAAFTPGSDDCTPVAGMFDDATPDSVDEGDAGVVRMSANRNLYSTLRDAAGNERGANVTASNELNVIATAQPGVDIGDVTINGPVGGGTEAGAVRVTIANDSTGLVSVDDGGAALTVDNGGTFAVQVDGDALTSLQLIDDAVAAEGEALGKGVLLQGDDGTDRTNVLVDTAGHLQVDVLSGGGETAPSNPTVDTDSGSAIAAGSSDNLVTSTLNGTEKLSGADICASVGFKYVVGFSSNGSSITTTYSTGFGNAGEVVQWRPPHRDYCEVSGDNSDDVFMVTITNMDTSQAADLYASFYYQDN